MFCPGCGMQVNNELKFCKQCGANLRGVQEAMVTRAAGEKFDWSKTWMADMVMNEEERNRKKGITPETKRLEEVKVGVITTLAGIGVMIFFGLFFASVAKGENVHDAELLRRLWLIGLVPFLVGIGFLFNGLFIGKRLVQLKQQQAQPLPQSAPTSTPIEAKTTDQLLTPAATPLADFSVTEATTANLPDKLYAPPRRETN